MSVASSELPKPLGISQPYAITEVNLTVPPVYVERFKAVAQLACEGTVPEPNLIAAVVIGSDETSELQLSQKAKELAAAEQYLRENPGAPFVNANRAQLTAGIVDQNHGFTIFDWGSTIDYGTGIALPVLGQVQIEFSGNNVLGVKGEVPSEEPAKFMTPETVVTPRNYGTVDLAERAKEGGILAVGKEAVRGLERSASGRRLASRHGHLAHAAKIASSILEVADSGK